MHRNEAFEILISLWRAQQASLSQDIMIPEDRTLTKMEYSPTGQLHIKIKQSGNELLHQTDVTLVVVEAKGLKGVPDACVMINWHNGSENVELKTKVASKSADPVFDEQFDL